MITSITVIIPTMNRPESLKRTLDFISACTDKPSEVIVVDQSQDSNLALQTEMITKKCAQNIHSIYLYQSDPSLTKARNYGIKYASNDIIVCSDDDVDVQADTFTIINKTMANKNIAMIAGLDKNTKLSEGSKLGYLFGTKSYKKRKIGYVTWSMFGRFPVSISGITDTEWAMGFFFVIRKSLQQKWNIWWDEQLISYAYAEDLDFSYAYYKNANSQNMRCIFHPDLVVTHRVTKEFRVPSRKSTLMYIINREYLAYKHRSSFSRFATRWSNFWRIITAAKRPQLMKNLIEGQIKTDIHRSELRKGILPPNIFD